MGWATAKWPQERSCGRLAGRKAETYGWPAAPTLDAQDELTRSLYGQLRLEPSGETRLVSGSCSGRHSEMPAGRVIAHLPSAAIHLQERGNPPQDRSHSRLCTRELTPDPLCQLLCRQMPFALARERVQTGSPEYIVRRHVGRQLAECGHGGKRRVEPLLIGVLLHHQFGGELNEPPEPLPQSPT